MSSTEEKVEDLGSEVELEQRLIQQGKSNYSLEGDKLLEFVEKRLEAARDRERRTMDRELKRIERGECGSATPRERACQSRG